MAKMLHVIREERYLQSDDPLKQVAKRRVGLYVLCQCLAIAVTVGMSQTIGAIGEPCGLSHPFGYDTTLTDETRISHSIPRLDSIAGEGPSLDIHA